MIQAIVPNSARGQKIPDKKVSKTVMIMGGYIHPVPKSVIKKFSRPGTGIPCLNGFHLTTHHMMSILASREDFGGTS